MFFNPVPYNELHNYLSLADIGLVNLNKDSNNVCVPSKILSYYSNSLPVLASMPLSNLASKYGEGRHTRKIEERNRVITIVVVVSLNLWFHEYTRNNNKFDNAKAIIVE